jgi:hypothetical protein
MNFVNYNGENWNIGKKNSPPLFDCGEFVLLHVLVKYLP